MITIRDGDVYQWDSGRQIEVDSDVCEVHFASCNSKDAYVTVPVDGVCNIPNILLQTGEDFVIYAVCQKDECEQTVEHLRVWVKQRAKPSDYVYTETEVFSYKALEERIEELEKNGGSSGGTSGVSDVTVNGTSIVADGVANIPIASVSQRGVVSLNNSYGILVEAGSGALFIDRANETFIDGRNNQWKPITPRNLDYAVKVAMCDGKGTEWTPQEKNMAKARMGVGEWRTLFDVTLEEAVGSVTINTDMDGNAFQVEELIIIIEGQVEQGRVRIIDTTNKFEDFVNIYINNSNLNNPQKYVITIGQQVDNTHRIERAYTGLTGGAFETISVPAWVGYGRRNVKYLTRLSIDNNGGNFLAGARIMVGGR